MTDFVFSTDEETYNDDFESACDDVFSIDEGVKIGDIRTIYRAEPKHFQASDFFPNIDWVIEHMQEMAHGEVGEHSEGFLMHLPEGASDELNAALIKTVQAWSDKHNLDPDFYGVTGVTEVKVRIDSFEGDYGVAD